MQLKALKLCTGHLEMFVNKKPYLPKTQNPNANYKHTNTQCCQLSKKTINLNNFNTKLRRQVNKMTTYPRRE